MKDFRLHNRLGNWIAKLHVYENPTTPDVYRIDHRMLDDSITTQITLSSLIDFHRELGEYLESLEKDKS